ncbi:hypothetical protein DKX38_030104 (mitochondrion) [Salix brachista]|uniref:Uncharacterized protein n=1 Tax=Salix brachista TaxID=2182728 RepID=A0A5N5IVJ2_9ROSI|nr:hypothetical protein DKX38_030104 [Salix brachista]
MNRKMPTKWKLFIVSPEPSGLYTQILPTNVILAEPGWLSAIPATAALDSFDDLPFPDKNTWEFTTMDQPIGCDRTEKGNLSELSLPGSRAVRLPNRQADSERFMAVLKLRGTGHQLSILPLAVDRRSDVLKSGGRL